MLRRAAEVDAGFDATVLAEMIDTLDRFDDADLPVHDVAALRSFFRAWASELRHRSAE